MEFQRFAEKLETLGIVTSNGERIYGTAAVVYWLGQCNRPVSSFKQDDVARGRAFVERML